MAGIKQCRTVLVSFSVITVEPGGIIGVSLDLFMESNRQEFLSCLQPNLDYTIGVVVGTEGSQQLHHCGKE